MFGYVVTNQSELKVKELSIYKGYYCGLCKTLRNRHGIFGQLTLTYDMTFLAILLSSLYEPQVTEEMRRCIVHPKHKQRMIYSEYTEYVADMNVLLSYFKAKDDWNDEHKLTGLAFSKLIRQKNFSYRKKADEIASLLQQLKTLEEKDEQNIDVMAGLFGKIMAILFVPKQDEWSSYLERMGFFLGKFIYILDAYDDLENDIKKKNYNPFKSVCKEPDFDDKIKSLLTMMMAECCTTFEMLPIIQNVEILRNILYAGIWSTFYRKKQK